MKLSFSHHNQIRENGALPRMVWLHRPDGTLRVLGVVSKTTYGAWQANIDDRDRPRSNDFATLAEAKQFCRDRWA